MTEKISVNVNGEAHHLDRALGPVNALVVLREELGLRRTRYGCGSGSCGACTIIVDGQARTSCDIPLEALHGCQLETAECLGTPDRPHPIVQCLIKHQAAQCAYCMSGIAMRIKSLLQAEQPADEAGLLQALDQHLCRCGAHSRILRAARELLADSKGAL